MAAKEHTEKIVDRESEVHRSSDLANTIGVTADTNVEQYFSANTFADGKLRETVNTNDQKSNYQEVDFLAVD